MLTYFPVTVKTYSTYQCPNKVGYLGYIQCSSWLDDLQHLFPLQLLKRSYLYGCKKLCIWVLCHARIRKNLRKISIFPLTLFLYRHNPFCLIQELIVVASWQAHICISTPLMWKITYHLKRKCPACRMAFSLGLNQNSPVFSGDPCGCCKMLLISVKKTLAHGA